MTADSAACPCGAGRGYAECCGRLHAGEPAADAEALMRSRYAAFVRGDAAYLRATWDPATCPANPGVEEPGAACIQWLGLTVKQHRRTGPDSAEVEFVARYRVGGGSAVRLHELSRFVRRGGRWYYLDGDHR